MLQVAVVVEEATDLEEEVEEVTAVMEEVEVVVLPLAMAEHIMEDYQNMLFMKKVKLKKCLKTQLYKVTEKFRKYLFDDFAVQRLEYLIRFDLISKFLK